MTSRGRFKAATPFVEAIDVALGNIRMRRLRFAGALIVVALGAASSNAQSRFTRPVVLTRQQEVELALSAAPATTAPGASVLVLEDTGYALARLGVNGFTCLVEHEDRKAVEPVCYDAEGSATTLVVSRFLARRRAAGDPDSVTMRSIEAGYASGRFSPPRKPGVAFMLSPRGSMPPHLMFYAPYATRAQSGLPGAGTGARGMPFLYGEGKPNAYFIVMIPTPSQR
jgi:hypothetical protein